MPKTAGRLLQLLSLLHTRRFWRGEELAEELRVTARSVRRDAERLRELGYPIHASGGVGGGYRLGAGRELPPLPLEDDEAIAVAIGLREAAAGSITGVEEAAVRALTKLESVLPQRLRRRVNALQAVSVRLGDQTPRIDAALLSTVASACRDSLELRFTYRSHGDVESRRAVEPYRLVHTRLRWYLVAWDLGRGAWRTFRVDRIAPRPLPGRTFTPRPLPADDLAAWVSQSVSTDVYRYRAKVTLHLSAEEAGQKLSGVAARIEPLSADRCLMHTGSDSLEGLAFHLGFLGFEFEVHEPPELRDHLLRLSQRLGRAAAGTSDGKGTRQKSRRGPRALTTRAATARPVPDR